MEIRVTTHAVTLKALGENREPDASIETFEKRDRSYVGAGVDGSALRFWYARDPAAMAPTLTATTAIAARPWRLKRPCGRRLSRTPARPLRNPRIPAGKARTSDNVVRMTASYTGPSRGLASAPNSPNGMVANARIEFVRPANR